MNNNLEAKITSERTRDELFQQFAELLDHIEFLKNAEEKRKLSSREQKQLAKLEEEAVELYLAYEEAEPEREFERLCDIRDCEELCSATHSYANMMLYLCEDHEKGAEAVDAMFRLTHSPHTVTLETLEKILKAEAIGRLITRSSELERES